MAKTLEGRAKALVQDKNFAHVSILREDGSIQTVVVWVHASDDGNVELNGAEGREWPNNLRRAGTATVSVANAENPYGFVSVTRRLAEDTHEGADEHIDFLAKKYLDVDVYPGRKPGERRVKLVLEPETVVRRKPR